MRRVNWDFPAAGYLAILVMTGLSSLVWRRSSLSQLCDQIAPGQSMHATSQRQRTEKYELDYTARRCASEAHGTSRHQVWHRPLVLYDRHTFCKQASLGTSHASSVQSTQIAYCRFLLALASAFWVKEQAAQLEQGSVLDYSRSSLPAAWYTCSGCGGVQAELNNMPGCKTFCQFYPYNCIHHLHGRDHSEHASCAGQQSLHFMFSIMTISNAGSIVQLPCWSCRASSRRAAN